MSSPPHSAEPPNLHFHDLGPTPADFRAAVITGLSRHPRQLSPRFFYDEKGSALFDLITRLPEYYPTRTEIELLRRHGAEIAALLGHGGLLIELGSGSNDKIRVLLDAVQPAAYLPIDISGAHLRASARALAADHPHMQVHALCADYTRPFALPTALADLRRAAFYPGSSIGNFEPAQARQLLQRVASLLGPGGRLLIGVDLQKPVAILEAAYDDAQGVTARFNRNLLVRMRDELGADVLPEDFSHLARYNHEAGRIEMHLTATRPLSIGLDAHRFDFAQGDGIHTENSYKYTLAGFEALAGLAGFTRLEAWCDEQRLFSVHCLEVREVSGDLPAQRMG